MAGTTSRIALFSASILPLMAMDPEQSSSQITWRGLPAYSPPGRTAIVFILPLVSQEIKPMAFRPCKREGERHGFSNRHPYKNSKRLYEWYVFSMFAVVDPGMRTADLSTSLRSGRDDKSIVRNKLVISTGA